MWKKTEVLGLICLPLLLQNCMTESTVTKDATTEKSATPVLIEQAYPGKSGILKTGTLLGEPITYSEIEGKAVFEGDILLTSNQLTSQNTLQKEGSTGINSNVNLGYWPNNVVYYVIDPALPNAYRVTDAISSWQSSTLVRFVPWTNQPGHPNYVKFMDQVQDPTDCHSALGQIGGMQIINLGSNCSTGNTIHEIGHAVGLIHEQSRGNQSSSIVVNWNNILSNRVIQYYSWNDPRSQLYHNPPLATDWTALDTGSVMMYPSYGDNTWAVNPGIPMMTLPNGKTWNAQRTSLSTNDIYGVNVMYPSIWTSVYDGGIPISHHVAATDIGVGANGQAWVITNTSTPGGYTILRQVGNAWSQVSGGGIRIDVDPNGNAWIINNQGSVYKWNGSSFQTMGVFPGGLSDIGVGANGYVYVVTKQPVAGGYTIMNWTGGTTWSQLPGGAVRISVDQNGHPWVVNNVNHIFNWNGYVWSDMSKYSGNLATDIGCGSDGTIYVINNTQVAGGYQIAIWEGGGNFKTIPGGGLNVDVGPDGNPWLANDAVNGNYLFN